MNWLIITPQNGIQYSPSLLNFYEMLKRKKHNCFIVDVTYNKKSQKQIQGINGIRVYVRRPLSVSKFSWLPLSSKIIEYFYYRYYIYLHEFYIYHSVKRVTHKLLKKLDIDRFVGVDAIGYLVVSKFSRSAIYFSLEIDQERRNKDIFKNCKPALLIIQSKERADYLSKSIKEVAYIQNAPILDGFPFTARDFKGRFVYFGLIMNVHGVEYAIQAVDLMQTSSLVIKGFGSDKYIQELKDKYHELIDCRRLIIDTGYIEQSKVLSFLSDFDVGFCFYDLKTLFYNFNHVSSPAGKMFNYFAASLPVIGNDIIGLRPVVDSQAGVLLPEITPLTVSRAITTISKQYRQFSRRAYLAAQKYDFEKMFNDEWSKLR